MNGTWELIDDPARFLSVAGTVLAADPVVASVVTTTATREAARRAGGAAPPAHPHWYAVLRDAHGAPTSVVMRTAPAPPHPLFCLPVPDGDAVALARLLHERGEAVTAANGALPAARVLAGETARLRGGRVVTAVETVLWEVDDVVEPPRTTGRLRVATPDDAATLLPWLDAFLPDADEQAGRPRGSVPHLPADPADVLQRVEDRRLWIWEVDGEPVHVTGYKGPADGVARVGPVYTPPEHRGRGYGRAAVAAVTRMLRDRGHRVCLFTDRANPTSNPMYAAVGYRPVADMADVVVVDARGARDARDD